MKKFFVIGNPINHSLSPQLHNHWLKKNQINAVYDKKKLTNEDLRNFFFKIKKNEISGANVTVPFKQKVISYLDELSIEAEKTQSVNTVYLKNNKIIGHNTDISGFELAIKNTKYNIEKKEILILGAGGVVPSIIYALINMKAHSVTLSNRTKVKAENLKNLFRNLKVVDWGEIPNFDMVINATSIGLEKNQKLNLDFSKIGSGKFFYDVIYNPKETNFLEIGKNLGNETENGKNMFIFQAAQSFKIWHGIQPEIDLEVNELLDK